MILPVTALWNQEPAVIFSCLWNFVLLLDYSTTRLLYYKYEKLNGERISNHRCTISQCER